LAASKALLASTDTEPIYRRRPDLIGVKIGGQRIINRGRAALMPILAERVDARSSHQILITTGRISKRSCARQHFARRLAAGVSVFDSALPM
jgi:hypothetical protein